MKRSDRIVIQAPQPLVDDGRYPVKRCAGDGVAVSVDIFRDGHELLEAVVRYRRVRPQPSAWGEAPLRQIDAHLDGVRWAGEFEVDEIGDWEYEIDAWVDRFGTWRDELLRKLGAGQTDLAGELSEGRLLLDRVRKRAAKEGDAAGAAAIGGALELLAEDPARALTEELTATVERHQKREGEATIGPFPLRVDRELARFGAWYELFPRSWGGFKGVEEQIPRLAELGFDVVYLPPIHPIGHTNRKGANNSPQAGPDDPGSPWAIGDEHGGHDAIHPDLGTDAEFRQLVKTARAHGIDIALDFAINCSADHPWLREHPEWFNRRPDGTLKYAENPPKRYQDIYNVNWDTPDWRGLWQALLEVMLHWVDRGVKVFRVDNPHTKPAPFWEWLISEVQGRDPEVVLLAEAFTRRAVMRHLAKVGFTQSYTYFTWKNSRYELTEYVSELAYTDEREYFRPNFFANTPDILHAYLQDGGRPAFEARLVLAATLSPSYGIYSGFESYENTPVREGSEEYMHSEKYELYERDLNGPLLPLIQRLNHARRDNPALQHLDNITFLDTANDALIAYAKQSQGNTVLTVVNIDTHQTQEGLAMVPAHLGLAPVFTVHDLIGDGRFEWRIGGNYVRLAPGRSHVARVEGM
ncbi:MAG TPA: alpha-1,4-glucan--maltose-1-phosphate maltosyltransferase [Solirubrobacteraceae bacterium]|nr:alpha-1,4-glucan--maltose-1-phosphate maltosyltransferase [Solirubrobacteraceae bacterium]